MSDVVLPHDDPEADHMVFDPVEMLMLCGQQGPLHTVVDEADLTCCGCITVAAYPD
jgi:hypothetical protein